MLSCKGVSARASDYLDRQQPRGERVRVMFHLLICGHCRRFMRQFRLLLASLRVREPPAVTPEYVDRLMVAIKEHRKKK